MKLYEGPELQYIGRLTVQTLSSSGSKGSPGQGDDNDDLCNPAEDPNNPDCDQGGSVN